MNKRQLKKASRSSRNWRLSPHLQIKASKWFDPWTHPAHELKIGDKYLNCAGEVRTCTAKDWHNHEYQLTDERGFWCYTSQCFDALQPEHQNLPNGTKLPPEILNQYWGSE